MIFNKAAKLFLLLLLIISSFSQNVAAQTSLAAFGRRVDSLSSKLPQAINYIQTSKDVYETGEDLWFKGYIINSQYLTPFAGDTTFYVQLIQQIDKKSVIKEKYLIVNGFVNGHLLLPDSLESGDYILAGFSASSYAPKAPVTAKLITIVKRAVSTLMIDAHLAGKDNTGIKNDMEITLKSKEGNPIKSATLTATLVKADSLVKSYAAQTNNNGFGRVAIQAAELLNCDKIIVKGTVGDDEAITVINCNSPVKATVNMSFLPEGGNLVNGMPCNVAFKAVLADGSPVSVTGVILENDKPIIKFTSIHDGMGKFILTPSINKHYTAKLNGIESSYSLPEISAGGFGLAFKKITGDSLYLLVRKSKNLPATQVNIVTQIRGKVCGLLGGIIKGDSLMVKINIANFPQGIAEITLYDITFEPVAERLVYVKSNHKLYISQNLSKTVAGKKDKLTVKIKTTDNDGHPVSASLGLSVYKTNYQNPVYAGGILSTIYLRQQVKGDIFNADYYFDDGNKDKNIALDLLLMTQGWRRYVWSTSVLKTQPAQSYYLNNSLTVNLSSRGGAYPALLVFTYQPATYQKIVNTNTHGIGQLTPADLQQAPGRFLYVKMFGDDELLKKTAITIVEPFPATNNSDYKISHNKILAGNETPDKQASVLGITNLREVVIKAQKKGNVYSDKYLGSLDSMAKLEFNGDYVGKCGILNCPACLSGTRPVAGRLYSKWISNRRPALHPFLFTANEVKGEVYRYPHYSEEELMKMYYMTRTKGYAKVKEFYQPQYDNPALMQLVDSRNTLVWNPEVITDKNGEATINFYTSDLTGKFNVYAEGLDTYGLLGARQTSFTVLDKIPDN